jgi:hypothetical protein
VKEFSASYDRTTKIVSILVSAFLIAIPLASRSLVIGGLPLLVLLISYIYSPRGYVVSSEGLIVKRWVGNILIPLESIQEIRPVSAGELRGSLRLWGSGALFGYYGIFRTPNMGNARWYVTDRGKCVAVRSETKTYIVSPDDVDGFMAAMKTWAPMVIHTSESPAVSGPVPKLIAIVATVIPLALVAAAWLYSPGTPGYTLTPDSLSIHDRLYPVTLQAASVDVPEIRVVDISTDTEWRPVMRTGGFANTHYKAGFFRVAGGERVRMYRTTQTRLVLLPPKGSGTPVLLEAAEPEQFVQEVRREWAGLASR